MSPDLLSMLLGAALVLLGLAVGVPIGFAWQRSRAIGAREPSPYVCGCGHALATHDPETNQCHAGVEADEWNDSGGIYVTVTRACPCRQYVGERPVDIEAVLDDFTKKHPLPPSGQA